MPAASSAKAWSMMAKALSNCSSVITSGGWKRRMFPRRLMIIAPSSKIRYISLVVASTSPLPVAGSTMLIPPLSPYKRASPTKSYLACSWSKKSLAFCPSFAERSTRCSSSITSRGGVSGGGRHRVTGGRVDVGGRAERFHDLFSADHGAQWHP